MATSMNYSVDKTAIILGFGPVVGLTGDRVKIAFNSDEIETVMGTDGNGRHVTNLDKSGTVTITLEHGSPSNAEIMALRLLGEPFPIIVKDNTSMGTLFSTADAMLKKMPEVTLGQKPGDLEYVFTFISGILAVMPAKTY